MGFFLIYEKETELKNLLAYLSALNTVLLLALCSFYMTEKGTFFVGNKNDSLYIVLALLAFVLTLIPFYVYVLGKKKPEEDIVQEALGKNSPNNKLIALLTAPLLIAMLSYGALFHGLPYVLHGYSHYDKSEILVSVKSKPYRTSRSCRMGVTINDHSDFRGGCFKSLRANDYEKVRRNSQLKLIGTRSKFGFEVKSYRLIKE